VAKVIIVDVKRFVGPGVFAAEPCVIGGEMLHPHQVVKIVAVGKFLRAGIPRVKHCLRPVRANIGKKEKGKKKKNLIKKDESPSFPHKG
jgi:hypothetical protein